MVSRKISWPAAKFISQWVLLVWLEAKTFSTITRFSDTYTQYKVTGRWISRIRVRAPGSIRSSAWRQGVSIVPSRVFLQCCAQNRRGPVCIRCFSLSRHIMQFCSVRYRRAPIDTFWNTRNILFFQKHRIHSPVICIDEKSFTPKMVEIGSMRSIYFLFLLLRTMVASCSLYYIREYRTTNWIQWQISSMLKIGIYG